MLLFVSSVFCFYMCARQFAIGAVKARANSPKANIPLIDIIKGVCWIVPPMLISMSGAFPATSLVFTFIGFGLYRLFGSAKPWKTPNSNNK